MRVLPLRLKTPWLRLLLAGGLVGLSVPLVHHAVPCKLVPTAQATASRRPVQERVEPLVWQLLDQSPTVRVAILLTAQADLRPAVQIKDSDERGAFVLARLSQVAQASQRPLLDLLQQQGQQVRAFFVANVLYATIDRPLLDRLAQREDVRRIEASVERLWIEPPAVAQREETPAHSAVRAAVEWGVQSVRAPQVWALGFAGQGMVIADADTGVDHTHPALRTQYRGAVGGVITHDYHWHDAIHGVRGNPCGADNLAPCDDNGHGTHTTGTVVGDDGVGNQVGVAPAARWMGCRNMDRGFGTPERYTECFQFFIAPTDSRGGKPQPSLRPHVINNSWGCPTDEGCAPLTLRVIVENTQASGIFVEASAGNSGPGCSTVNDGPALLEAAFSTGSYDSAGRLSGFSSRGPVLVDASHRLKPDVVAPGSRVRSTLPGGRFGNLSGTSMAGPHVVGVVALLWSARPTLVRQIEATQALLRATADPHVGVPTPQICGAWSSDVVPNHTFGFGRVDALAAVTR